MKKLAELIIKYKGAILALFILLAIVSGYFATQVETNFDLFSYVPKSAQSTIAIETMADEFEQDIPNAEIGVPELSITEALHMKQVFASLPYVQEVLWLDDQCDLAIPLDLLDQKVVEGFYKEGMALYHLTITDDAKAQDILLELQQLAGPEGVVRGQVVELAFMQRGVTVEMARILAFAVPVALLILLFATKSWFEPVLFMIVIFVGVLFNMGTNALFKDVSFITQAVGSVLQLAVSMDYAIFLLHRFSDYRDQGHSVEEAMKLAIVKSFKPVSSSALTTFFGFLMLIFMRFRIGPDLGLVLAKGVVFSLLSVFLLLPVLVVYTYKIIDKTTHKSLLPSFKGLSRLVVRIGIPVMVICALVAVPAYLGQRSNHFLYGAQSYPVGTREARDSDRLNDQFGENMQMALLVPKGQWAVEQQLAQDLLELPEMKSSMGYVTQVGTGIPPDILPDRILSPLISEHYSRLILIAESPAESPETYELAQTIREMVDDAYPEGDTHLAGANFVMFDMKTTINQDLPIVNGLAILAIALVIMLAFRSVALPLILVMTIELSIWINLAIPYLTGTPLNFIGYLVISTVQLGATVDYGILMAQHYVDHRQLLNRKQAAMKSVQTVAGSIIPPALILAAAGFILYFVSSISVVSELGIVLGRGALISLAMVLFLLPNLLRLFDRFIDKTTWKLQMAPDPHSYRRQPAENKSEFDTIKEIKPVNTGRNRMNRIRLKKRKNERGRNWGKYAAGLMAITVFLSFMPGLVRADKTKELITLPNNNSGKREVVYGKLSASGNVEQIYVVNHFHPKDKTALTDYGDYESVIQLTGTVAPLVSNSTVTIAEVEGPYYYQGNLISREIPWNFEIAYRLNGEKRLPETLSGESGRLEMALEISQNEAVDPVFFDHYALQISIPIDPDRVIIEAASEGFLVASGGTEHQLNYIVLPGQETTIKLVLDVNDYAMGQITLAGVLLSFDMDLSEMEDQLAPLDDLSSGIADFAEGADRLNAGYRDLQNAFKAIVAGSGQLADGGRQLDQGVQELAKGSRQLLNEGSQLTSGYGELLKNFKTIISGSGELVDGGRQLDQGVQELAKGSRLLLNEGANLKAGSQDILDGLTQITDNLPSSDVFESLEIPEFGEEDMQRLEQVVEYLDMLVPLLDRLLEYEDELEDLRALVNELIGWLNQIEIPDQGGAPVTQEQWRAYFEGLGIDIPEGAESLYEQLAGLSEAAAGNAPALERIKELLDELVVLSKDIPELDMSVVEMIDEIKALVGQAKELMELIRTLGPMFSHFGELIDGLNELQTGYVQFHAGLVQYIDDGVGGITEGLEGTDSQPGLASGSTEFVDGVASLNSGLNQYYSDGLVKFSGGLDQYIDRGVGGITAGLEGTSSQPGLASGAADYVDGVASLRKGLVQYNADGLVKFSGGIAQLSDGASILKNETSGLRQVFEDAIREQLDQFGNVGFETVSFVSDKNKDVSSVQFVFMTEEIPPVNGK